MSQSDPVPSPTDPRIAEIRHEMRCAVTLDRVEDYGCRNPGATIMAAEWRCPTCAAWEALGAAEQRLEQVTKERDAERRCRIEDASQRVQEQLAFRAAIASLKASRDEYAARVANRKNLGHHDGLLQQFTSELAAIDHVLSPLSALASSEGTERQP